MSIGTVVEEISPAKEDQQDQDLHSVSCLILGDPGNGKTASLRNCDPEDVLLIQPIRKSLPFPSKEWALFDESSGTGTIYVTSDADDICAAIKGAHKIGKKIVVVDDWQYIMASAFMAKAMQRGYDKFTEIGLMGWNTLEAASQAGPGVNVYFLSHTASDNDGIIRTKTIGKMIDEKIVVEGMFPIVLRAVIHEKKHCFSTVNSGQDTVKAPMGMFADPLIDNDLAAVDAVIRGYYSN